MILTFGDVSRRIEILHNVTFSMAKEYIDYQVKIKKGEAPGEPSSCPEIVQQFCQGRLTGQCKICLGMR
jgi:hypothetical protein